MPKPDPIPGPTNCGCCGTGSCRGFKPGKAPRAWRLKIHGFWGPSVQSGAHPCDECDMMTDIEVILKQCFLDDINTGCVWTGIVPACIANAEGYGFTDVAGIGWQLSVNESGSGHNSPDRFWPHLTMWDIAYGPGVTPGSPCGGSLFDWTFGGSPASWTFSPEPVVIGFAGFDTHDLDGGEVGSPYPAASYPWYSDGSYGGPQCHRRKYYPPYDENTWIELEALG